MPRPKKSLGQNFLIDPLVIDRTIQHLNPLPSDNFLEIGPGRGAITQPFCLLYTSPSPRDGSISRMPSSA